MDECNVSAPAGKVPGPGLIDAQAAPDTELTPARKPTRKSGKKQDVDFPLWLHPSGRWCRKIKGRFHYFGRNKEAAAQKWADQKDDLLAGRTPRVKSDGLMIGDLAERFLNSKRKRVESGRLSPRTFADYLQTCTKVVGHFGKLRRVDDLAPDDFESLQSEFAKTRGVVGVANAIRLTRILFKYAVVNRLLERGVEFGSEFSVTQAAIRKAAVGKAQRMFPAPDLRKLLKAADPVMQAMILLGVNCAFGQSDLSSLPQSALDLTGGWVNFPRVKTGVSRRAKLWPETVAAVRKAMKARPTPAVDTDGNLVFVTKFGHRWVRVGPKGGPIDSVALEFGKLLQELELKQPGLQFYALRHTFRTVADATRDFPAIDLVMGHSDTGMGARYRQSIDDERLQAVADHVRSWLFPPKRRAR